MVKEKKQPTEKSAIPQQVSPPWMKVFVWSVLGCAGLLGLWACGVALGRVDEINRFASEGWGQYAAVIVDNKIRSLWHAAFMMVCAGGALWFFLLNRQSPALPQVPKPVPRLLNRGSLVAWLLVLLVAGDAWLLSRHYVKTMPLSSLDENPVISLLKKDMPVHRVALVSQDGFYNWWLTYMFPYHNIQAVNVTQMPRMPEDYKKFLSAVTRNPVRYWQLAAVGYVLAPVQVWDQLRKDPVVRDVFELTYSYNVGQAEAGVSVIPASPVKPGQHVVLRFRNPGPRYALIAGWESCSDAETLQRLATPTRTPFGRTLLAPECATNVPPLTGEGVMGKVELLNYRSGLFHLKTTSDQPAILRVSEKYDKDWVVRLDGNSAPLLRVDYIFQGVYVPAGAHDVELTYSPSKWPLKIQVFGMLICLGAGIGLLIERIRRLLSSEKQTHGC
ncbi:MAG: hypothetical protein WCI20_00980 [bacterium]